MNNVVVDWNALLKIISASACSALVFVALINWRRHSKEDAAKAKKTEAEAKEIEEKRSMIRLERDERIFEISTKLAEKLSEECELTKRELDLTLKELNEVRQALAKANQKCSELQTSLERERENNKICSAEVEQLKIELERLKREDRRRPI